MGVCVTVLVAVCALFLSCVEEAVEDRNMSNDCALNRYQKRRFTTFYSVLFYFYTFSFVRSHCLPFLFLESERQMLIFYAFIMNNVLKYICMFDLLIDHAGPAASYFTSEGQKKTQLASLSV